MNALVTPDLEAEMNALVARMQAASAAGEAAAAAAGEAAASPRRVGLLPAREIREASAAGSTDAELAAQYHSSPATISRIVRGVTQPRAGGPILLARPGAAPTVASTVLLPVDLAAAIDRERGAQSRSAWLVEAARRLLESGASGSRGPNSDEDPAT
jgi:hypothetical protein